MATASPKASVLFATIAAGGGHVATARAMKQALERLYPGQFELTISDYMRALGERDARVAAFDRRHKAMWTSALRWPQSARLGQRLIDAFPSLTQRIERRLLDAFAQTAARDLAEHPHDLVVSNHGLLTTGLSRARARYGLRVPVLTFATETHNISAYWADPEAERVLVPNEAVRARLARLGVPAARLEVVGYPVQQAFLEAPGKAEARAALGLEEGFTVLVSLGGEGVGGDPLALARALAEAEPGWQVVVMCGRNAALKRQLEALGKPKLRAEGFTERMAEFLAASDAVIGKGGPASVYEALAVGRPVVVSTYAGLNERGVVQFVAASGLGAYAPSIPALLAALRGYARDPEALAAVAARCRALELGAQTERLAHAVVRYLERVRGRAA